MRRRYLLLFRHTQSLIPLQYYQSNPFFTNIIQQQFSTFNLLQLDHMLSCFIKPFRHELHIPDYYPKQYNENIFPEANILIHQSQSTAHQRNQIFINSRIQTFEQMINECLQEREVVRNITESGAKQQLLELQKVTENCRVIGDYIINSHQEDNYEKFFDGMELVCDITEKMKNSIKYKKTENTEILIQKILSKYHKDLKDQWYRKSCKDQSIQVAFMIDPVNSTDTQKLKDLEVQINELKDQILKQEQEIKTKNQEILKQSNLITKLQTEQDHKADNIQYHTSTKVSTLVNSPSKWQKNESLVQRRRTHSLPKISQTQSTVPSIPQQNQTMLNNMKELLISDRPRSISQSLNYTQIQTPNQKIQTKQKQNRTNNHQFQQLKLKTPNEISQIMETFDQMCLKCNLKFPRMLKEQKYWNSQEDSINQFMMLSFRKTWQNLENQHTLTCGRNCKHLESLREMMIKN